MHKCTTIHVKGDSKIKQYTEKFNALSDETRLRILSLLLNANTELCVCELTDALEVAQYNVSRHLKILKNAGLITERKEGRWVYFNCLIETDPFTATLFDSISSISGHVLSKDLDELNKRFVLRSDGKCLVGIQKKHLVGNHSKKQ